jgi:hypothetical protein
VAEVELAVGLAAEKFDDEGRLVDEQTRELLRDTVATLTGELDAELIAA